MLRHGSVDCAGASLATRTNAANAKPTARAKEKPRGVLARTTREAMRMRTPTNRGPHEAHSPPPSSFAWIEAHGYSVRHDPDARFLGCSSAAPRLHRRAVGVVGATTGVAGSGFSRAVA